MPTKQAQELDDFINKYNEYTRYAQYASDWAKSIIDVVPKLQADPNYVTALTAQEQADIEVNLLAAQESKIKPMIPDKLPIPPLVP